MQKHFPSVIFHPGQVYRNDIVYKFGLHMFTCSKPKMLKYDTCECEEEQEEQEEEYLEEEEQEEEN